MDTETRDTECARVICESEEEFLGEESDNDDDFIMSESEAESEEDGLVEDDDFSPVNVSREKGMPSTSVGRPRQFLYGKDNYKWPMKAPESRGRRSNVMHIAKCKETAAEARTPLESWTLLFPDEMLEVVVKHTNEEINRIFVNISNQTYHYVTNLTEMKAFIGLLYFAGIQRDRYKNTVNMWKESRCGLYRAVMSRNRFVFMCSCIRFDDKTTRAERQNTDRFAAFREIWSMFIENCKKYYTPLQNCTIDEQLLGFRGKFFAKVYIKNKPDKYGIKILCLNDSKTYYMLNATLYLGTVPVRMESVPTYYVRELSTPIHGSGRNIICNNWFSSIELIDIMKNKFFLTIVGTMPL